MNRLAAALLSVVFFCMTSDAAIVQLTLDGDTGEFISQGQMINATYDDSLGSTVLVFLTETIGGPPSDLRFVLNNSTNFAGNDFSGPRFRTTELGIPLAVGTFDNAMRAPFENPGFPGLSIDFAGRGANNAVDGSFTISELRISGTGQLERFSASFIHFADANPNELRGTITFTSATAVPEPGTLGLFAMATVATIVRRRRRRI